MRLARIALAALALLGVAAAGQEAPLVADTFTSPAHPATNYGSAQLLFVTGSGNNNAMTLGAGNQTWLEFDLSALPAGTTAAQVAKATLVLFANHVYAPGTVDVAVAPSGWNEATLTGAQAPAFALPHVATVPVATSQAFVSVDVTNAVHAWLSGAANYGLLLSADGGSASLGVAFDSKENTATGHQARLLITLTPSALVATNAGDSVGGQHIYSAPGGYSFTVPAGVSLVNVQLWGAGGGGSSPATQTVAGGGAGAYVEAEMPVQPGETLDIQVGAGGAAGSAEELCSPGTTCASSPTPGRTGSLSSVQSSGAGPEAYGGAGASLSNGTLAFPGAGGQPFAANAAVAEAGQTGTLVAGGAGYGAGAGGAPHTAGGSGMVILRW